MSFLLIGLTAACSSSFDHITIPDDRSKKEQTDMTEKKRKEQSKKNDQTDRKTMADDLRQYLLVDLQNASFLEYEAITAYESVTGMNYTDDVTTLETLKNEVIPTYTDLLDELYNVKVSNPILNELHSLYISGAEKQLDAFYLFVEGIEKQNPAIISEGNKILAEGKELIDRFVKEMEKLTLEYGISYY
jgi:hypothetical protein